MASSAWLISFSGESPGRLVAVPIERLGPGSRQYLLFSCTGAHMCSTAKRRVLKHPAFFLVSRCTMCQHHTVLEWVVEQKNIVHFFLQRDASFLQALAQLLELGLVRQADLEMTQPHGPCRGRRRTYTFPGVQADVVVVPAGRDEQGTAAQARHDIEPQQVVIERFCLGQVATS